ncbi:MAG: 1-(5-phosphoribosyl)-5-[(5-phosphoribosylamino)methylideneamino]imidazole-4-carboxamide isomerase [Rhodothalassiaceae bacterium]
MKLYPAIDIKDGRCVRLLRGDMAQATVFNDSPASQARTFVQAGCDYLHLVDLNGAFAGRPVNEGVVRDILKAVDVPVQLGGGIRTLQTIENWLEAGVARVILGTLALRDPDLVREACRQFPGRIAVGIDARDGRVAVDGWAEASDLSAVEVARAFEDAGVAAIIFTDIDRDGTLQGINVFAVTQLAEAVSLPIIASGGVRGVADLRTLAEVAVDCRGRIDGVVVGRALYNGGLSLADALDAVRPPPC